MSLSCLGVNEVWADALTPGVAGDVYDGVNLRGLVGDNIYYGAYDHARSGKSTGFGWGVERCDTCRGYDGYETPILWRVYGEEDSEGLITSVSEYILDSAGFSTQNTEKSTSWAGNNVRIGAGDYLGDAWYRQDSTPLLREWLEINFMNMYDAGKGIQAEKVVASSSNVSTKYIDRRSNAEYVIPPSSSEWYMWYAYTGVRWPHVVSDATVYVPHGMWGSSDNGLYWSANGVHSSAYKIADGAEDAMVAQIKYDDGAESQMVYWTRSPNSDSSVYAYVVKQVRNSTEDYFRTYSNVFGNDEAGVRPIFKMDPQQIIMTHEIVDEMKKSSDIMTDKISNDDWNYAASSSDVSNYKLTILSENVSLDSLTNVDGTSILGESSLPMDLTSGLALKSDNYDGDYLAYKIVEEDENGAREVVAYGTNKGSGALEILNISNIKNEVSGTAEFESGGNYTLYVWAQAEDASGQVGESIHSYEGSALRVFSLEIEGESNGVEEEKYVVLYDGNGHTSGNSPVDGQDYILSDQAIILGQVSLVKDGHEFIGWNTESDNSGTLYAEGDRIEIVGNMTLFAQWTTKEVEVETLPPDVPNTGWGIADVNAGHLSVVGLGLVVAVVWVGKRMYRIK
ncbi:MAG: InlB B-repeat-containing protein [Candidatus Saccharimonadales bacterium]